MATFDALQPTLARLRASYARSSVRVFLDWWREQLLACLPERARAIVAERVETLLLAREEQLLVLYRPNAGRGKFAEIPLGGPVEQQRVALERARSSIQDPHLRTFLCLPRQRLLLRRLTLPAAAENNLQQVLGFEMDRQTPFKVDQVYFDYRVEERNAGTRSIKVSLAVVPKPALDAELQPLSELDLKLDGIDIWEQEPGGPRLGFNFLPAERRVKRRNLRLRLNLALAAVAVLLLGMAMAQWVSNREQALAAMTTEVENLQHEAKQVTVLRQTLKDSIDAASFLGHKRRATPMMVDVMLDLTHQIPDTTYLERLAVDDNGQVQLQGQSDQAASLIESLKGASTLREPTLEGSIQPDPRTQKERFSMTANLRKEAGDEAAKPAK